MGATLFNYKTKDVLKAGMHGSTFGGNPLASAGAISIISRINDQLLDEVNAKSEYIINSLKGAKGIKGVTGAGLMLGVEVEGDAKKIVNECIKRGVIFLTAKTKVRMLPALNISYELLDRALTVLKQVCAEEL